MDMPLYSVIFAVLAEKLKIEHPGPMQVRYADNFSIMDSRRVAMPLMQRLGELRPSQGVLPEMENSHNVRP